MDPKEFDGAVVFCGAKRNTRCAKTRQAHLAHTQEDVVKSNHALLLADML